MDFNYLVLYKRRELGFGRLYTGFATSDGLGTADAIPKTSGSDYHLDDGADVRHVFQTL